MSAHSIFRSIRQPVSRRQMAIDMTHRTIEEYRALRMLAGSEAPETAETLDLLKRLAALMKGPHGAAVKPIAEQAFPVLAPPQGHA